MESIDGCMWSFDIGFIPWQTRPSVSCRTGCIPNSSFGFRIPHDLRDKAFIVHVPLYIPT